MAVALLIVMASQRQTEGCGICTVCFMGARQHLRPGLSQGTLHRPHMLSRSHTHRQGLAKLVMHIDFTRHTHRQGLVELLAVLLGHLQGLCIHIQAQHRRGPQQGRPNGQHALQGTMRCPSDAGAMLSRPGKAAGMVARQWRPRQPTTPSYAGSQPLTVPQPRSMTVFPSNSSKLLAICMQACTGRARLNGHAAKQAQWLLRLHTAWQVRQQVACTEDQPYRVEHAGG